MIFTKRRNRQFELQYFGNFPKLKISTPIIAKIAQDKATIGNQKEIPNKNTNPIIKY